MSLQQKKKIDKHILVRTQVEKQTNRKVIVPNNITRKMTHDMDVHICRLLPPVEPYQCSAGSVAS